MKRLICFVLLIVIGMNLFACDAETIDPSSPSSNSYSPHPTSRNHKSNLSVNLTVSGFKKYN